MPYICLANANLPGGALQITDLWPNESQRIPGMDPPGQNRYLNRPANDLVGLSGAGALTVVGLRASANKSVLEGLGAYLADVVDPGGSQQATGTVTMAGPLVGDTLTFTGPGGVLTRVFTAIQNTATGTVTVVNPAAGVGALTIGGKAFTCLSNKATGGKFTVVAAANVGDQVTVAGVYFQAAAADDYVHAGTVGDPILWDQTSGTVNGCATSLRAAINSAQGQAAITAALDALVPVATGGTVAAGGALGFVDLTPSLNGTWGQAVLTVPVGSPGRLTKTDFTAPVGANPSANPPEFCSYAQYIGQTVATRKANVATSLAAAINSAATMAAMDALNAGPVPTADFGHVTAVAGATSVALTASQPGHSGKLSLATAQVVDLAISGAELTLVQADPANFEFDSLINSTAGTNITVANSLVSCLNNAASDTALGTTIGGSTVTATNAGGASAIVTITADTAGSKGAMAITPSAVVRTAVSAGALAKTMVSWTATRINACVTALQALVDAGGACTASGINAALNGVAGVSGISVATGASSVADILSILAGRVYQIPVGTVKDPTGQNWDAANAAGSFTTPNVVFDTQMSDGEWRSAAGWIKHGKEKQSVVIGGDTVNNEIGGVRSTVDSAHFQSSLQTGQLSHYAAGVGLFPDADVRKFVSNWTRRTHRLGPLSNQRVVTVYDDDGTVLA